MEVGLMNMPYNSHILCIKDNATQLLIHYVLSGDLLGIFHGTNYRSPHKLDFLHLKQAENCIFYKILSLNLIITSWADFCFQFKKQISNFSV